MRGLQHAVVLRVRSDAQPDAALRSLANARLDIRSLEGRHGEGPAFVSEPCWSSQGPFLYIDPEDLRSREILEIPQLIKRRLELDGVAEGIVEVVPRTLDPLGPLASTPLVAAMVIRQVAAGDDPRFAGSLPEWLEPMVAWVLDASVVDEVEAFFESTVVVDLPRDRVHEALASAAQARTRVAVMSTEAGGLKRWISTAANGWCLLGRGGSGFDAADTASTTESLRNAVLGLPSVAYAAITIDPDWRSFQRGMYAFPDKKGMERYLPPELFPRFAGQVVMDGLHWQLLTDGHREGMGDLPTGAKELDDGRWELTVGTAEQWRIAERWTSLPSPQATKDDDSPAAIVRREAREALGPLLKGRYSQ